MKYIFKTVFFALLILAVVVPSHYASPGLGLLFSLSALVMSVSIVHSSFRQEGAYIVSAASTLAWVGCCWAFQHGDLALTLVALLFCGTGVMSLLMTACADLFGDEEKGPPPSDTPIIMAMYRGLRDELSVEVNKASKYTLTLRRALQLTLWALVFASAAVLFFWQAYWIALAMSIAAIGLTFSYEASSVGRIRSTYGAFASLCLIGVLGPMSLGPLPLIFFVMMALMALLTNEQ